MLRSLKKHEFVYLTLREHGFDHQVSSIIQSYKGWIILPQRYGKVFIQIPTPLRSRGKCAFRCCTGSPQQTAENIKNFERIFGRAGTPERAKVPLGLVPNRDFTPGRPCHLCSYWTTLEIRDLPPCSSYPQCIVLLQPFLGIKVIRLPTAYQIQLHRNDQSTWTYSFLLAPTPGRSYPSWYPPLDRFLPAGHTDPFPGSTIVTPFHLTSTAVHNVEKKRKEGR